MNMRHGMVNFTLLLYKAKLLIISNGLLCVLKSEEIIQFVKYFHYL